MSQVSAKKFQVSCKEVAGVDKLNHNNSFTMRSLFAKHKIIDWCVVGLTILFFYWIKSIGFSYRFGDGNAYFYMADQFLRGLLPYQDFLIADPPLLIILLAGIKTIIGSSVILFQAVPILLESLTAIIIYLEAKKTLPNLAKFFPGLYLFSFLILSTTDYLTGLHFVTLLIALAYYFRHKPYVSGFLWGLATLIKLYVIPGFLGWLLFLKLTHKNQNLKKTIIAYVLTGAIFMMPFLIIAPKPVIDHIIIHQFNRPHGISKTHIFTFFIMHDFLLLLLAGVSLIITKKLNAFLPLISWLVFYLIFADIYYLYLGVMAFWLILAIKNLLEYLNLSSPSSSSLSSNSTTTTSTATNSTVSNSTVTNSTVIAPPISVSAPFWVSHNKQQLSTIVIVSLIFSQLIGVKIYHDSIQPKGVFSQVEEVSAYIQQLPEKPLYGSHEVAPLIALKTDYHLFDNHADTNAQLFGSGVLNKQTISKQAVAQGVYLLTKVANVPINANLDQGYEGYFDQEIFERYCTRLTIINGTGFELFTDVAIYECIQDE